MRNRRISSSVVCPTTWPSICANVRQSTADTHIRSNHCVTDATSRHDEVGGSTLFCTADGWRKMKSDDFSYSLFAQITVWRMPLAVMMKLAARHSFVRRMDDERWNPTTSHTLYCCRRRRRRPSEKKDRTYESHLAPKNFEPRWGEICMCGDETQCEARSAKHRLVQHHNIEKEIRWRSVFLVSSIRQRTNHSIAAHLLVVPQALVIVTQQI